MYYAYVLACMNTSKHYIGHTGNLLHRLEEHCRGNGAAFTKQNKPAEIRAVFEFESINDASEMKRFLELADKLGYLELILENAPPRNYISVLEFLKLLPNQPANAPGTFKHYRPFYIFENFTLYANGIIAEK